jgi:hypothetical protein
MIDIRFRKKYSAQQNIESSSLAWHLKKLLRDTQEELEDVRDELTRVKKKLSSTKLQELGVGIYQAYQNECIRLKHQLQ